MYSVRRNLLAFWLAASALAGCGSPPTVMSEPAAEYIGVAPAYADLAYGWLAGFADQDPLHELTLLVMPTADGLAAMESGELAFMITSVEPPVKWFVTPLARGAILLAASPSISVRGLDLDVIKDIFTGRIRDWSEIGGAPGPITPIVYPGGDELRLVFERQVLGNSRITSNALLAPDPAAMAELLAQEPAAIGFLPGHTLSADLKPFALAGIQPSQVNVDSGRYPLTVEILALAPKEPVGLARTWLGWIQSQFSSAVP